MKQLLVGLAVLTAAMLGMAAFGPQFVNAQPSIEKANATLKNTEREVADTLKRTEQLTEGMTETLAAPHPENALPSQLQQFEAETQRLQKLSTSLSKDIAAFDIARGSALSDFERELAQIKGPYTKRKVERLRDVASEQAGTELTDARATLVALQQVLEQGQDLHHATKCVEIGAKLEADGTDLDNQVQAAKTSAAEYSKRTEELLARLSAGVAATE